MTILLETNILFQQLDISIWAFKKQQSFSNNQINQIMQEVWDYTGSSAIETDTTSYFNRLTPQQQRNVISVQHYQKCFSFGPQKTIFRRISKEKKSYKKVLRYANFEGWFKIPDKYLNKIYLQRN